MIDFLAVIGGLCIIAIAALLLFCLYEFITEKVEEVKWTYKRNHRFDKPPTAKCYCKDCIYYSQRNGYGKCKRGHIDQCWNIADSWFCWQASPYSSDPDKEKKVQE
jgi:hypothetical protein